MIKPENPIRIGRINFTNVWPVFFRFPSKELDEQVEVVTQVPRELNLAMSAGKIDIGAISSFAYGENVDQYRLYPDLSVSAFGRVNSILLFYKKPFEHIINGKIALPTTSATSVNLLKIILEKFYGGKPSYGYASPSLGDMMKEMDAALLIGDDAIRARWNFPEYEVMDLGEQWTNFTGHWMSFAVWAVREEVILKYPYLVGQIYQAFQWSKRQGLMQREALVIKAQSAVGGNAPFWRNYFSQLCYDFGEKQRAGLQLYFQYAKELGLIHREIPLKIWTDNKVAQVKE